LVETKGGINAKAEIRLLEKAERKHPADELPFSWKKDWKSFRQQDFRARWQQPKEPLELVKRLKSYYAAGWFTGHLRSQMELALRYEREVLRKKK
jgi:hypothetical protein